MEPVSTDNVRAEWQLANELSEISCIQYLDRVVIDSRPETKSFGICAEAWQKAILYPVARAVELPCGFNDAYAGPRSFWITMPRGHDKTGAIGRLVNWCLGYSKKPIEIDCCALDADQAGLVMESARREVELNPWLKPRVEHGQKRSYGSNGSILKVLPADAPGAFGLKPDIIICDELTWWKKRDLWDAVISGKEKRPHCIVIVITNAGHNGSWQDELRQVALSDDSWLVYEAPGPLATWMDRAALDKARRLLPRGLARRVYDNIWVDPGEDDYLSRTEVLGCEELGAELGLSYVLRGRNGVRYAAGIDYGPKRDRTALAVGHLDPLGRTIIDRLDVLQGHPDAPIRVSQVEEWIDGINKDFNRPTLVFDPYQMVGTAEGYQASQAVVMHEARGGKANYEMAEHLRSLVVGKQLAWYPGAGTVHTDVGPDTLVDEFARLIIKVMTYGYRFDHPPGHHDDRVVSIGMLALALARMDPSGPGVLPKQPLTQRKAGIRDREDRGRARGILGRR